MFAPQDQSYTKVPEYILVIFDIRIPGVADRLHRERAAWQEQSDIEALDKDHFMLIVRPGGARRPAA